MEDGATQGGSFERLVSKRTVLDHDLHKLESRVVALGTQVSEAIRFSVYALARQNTSVATEVINSDQSINQERYAIEQAALNVLTLQQPVVSRDLRRVAALMFVAGELERMGDYAKGIARISLTTTTTYPQKEVGLPGELMALFEQMGKLASWMLGEALSAFVAQDVKSARVLAQQDSEMDSLYKQAYTLIVNTMLSDHFTADVMTNLLWVAHNLERLGDRVTNICERIEFIERGRFDGR